MWEVDRAAMGTDGDDEVFRADERWGSVLDVVLLHGGVRMYGPGDVPVRHPSARAGRVPGGRECRRQANHARPFVNQNSFRYVL